MHNRRKILFVIAQLGIGGGERQLFLLLKALDKFKYDLKIISFNPGFNDYWERPIMELGIPILFVKRSSNKFLRVFSLFKLIVHERPHVLVSWTLHLNFFVCVIGRICGVGYTIGSIRNDLFNPMKKDRPLHRFLGTKGAHIFIANSTKGKKDMVEKLGIPTSKVYVIFNAVELTESDLQLQSGFDRSKLKLPENVFLIVNIGRLEPSKNQGMLIKTIARVRKADVNVHVAFIGEGPSKYSYQQLANALGISSSVHFTGKVPMAIRYLHQFNLMCHTGLADGMPNVLLEAASQGLPLLSTRVNGSEDIIVNGQTGYIVECHDEEAMAQRIIELYNDPDKCKQLGSSAKQRILSDLFSVKTMANQFEYIFALS